MKGGGVGMGKGGELGGEKGKGGVETNNLESDKTCSRMSCTNMAA